MFRILPVESIVVVREARQRRDLTDIEELAESISRLGLINPITVDANNVLIAGERRLSAVKTLGWTHVPTHQPNDEIDERMAWAIELEENIKRVDLPWQERVQAIEAYHKLQRETQPTWSNVDTAAALGLNQSNVYRAILVSEELKTNPKVAEAPKFSVALGIVERNQKRRQESDLLRLDSIIKPSAAAEPAARAEILCSDFRQWALAYNGPRFNFVHCDFPYGINADQFNQGSADAHGGYADTEETYWTLCKTLCDSLDTLTSPDSHFIFWFSMKFYRETLAFFAEHSDVVFDPFPLMWMKTDNAGILPDPSRGPRRTYETALWGRRGDRPVVKAVANSYGGPTVRNTHMSEKPEPMLRHFFSMVVDKSSLVLDPTCGSGSAVRAAESLGAAFVRGLEINPEFAERAQLELVKARRLREMAGG
jgi:ParB family chromosome partitioning protein